MAPRIGTLKKRQMSGDKPSEAKRALCRGCVYRAGRFKLKPFSLVSVKACQGTVAVRQREGVKTLSPDIFALKGAIIEITQRVGEKEKKTRGQTAAS